MKISSLFIGLLACICISINTASAQNNEDTDKWVAQGKWRNGLKLKTHKGLNSAEFAKQYKANKAWWDTAFAFLRTTNLDTLSVGKHLIVGEDVFAAVSTGNPKPADKAGWESHQKYIDVHVMIDGKEKIGMMPAATGTVTTPYKDANDAANYVLGSNAVYFDADKNTMIILFPQEAHSPGVFGGSDRVKKVVLKIRYTN